MKAVYLLDERLIKSKTYTKDEAIRVVTNHYNNHHLTDTELADLLALIAVVYPDPEIGYEPGDGEDYPEPIFPDNP